MSFNTFRQYQENRIGKDSFILGKVSAPEIAKYKKKLVDEALKYLS